MLNLTVTAVTVRDNADLVLGFGGGVTLRASGAPSARTTNELWWLGDPRHMCAAPLVAFLLPPSVWKSVLIRRGARNAAPAGSH
ncbi:hypothetical protein [Micromonospora sp. CPCC 205714]|uniref:hypothetical protein n=1 Tax=Micromonospora sp. CPCC 205714 TaxID=3122402 RepID=UPI002FEE8C64